MKKLSVREIAELSPGFKKLKKKDQDDIVKLGEYAVQQSRNRIIFKRILWGAIAIIILAFLVG